MTPLDTELFNEYKRLDKLLREARGTEHGVTDYIDEMKATSRYEARSVLGWENDLNRLWRCRHIRNKLAHDDIPDSVQLSRMEDIEFLKHFYSRVMSGDDPLARLRRHRTGPHERTASSHTPPPIYTVPTSRGQYARRAPMGRSAYRNNSGCLAALLLTVISLPVALCTAAIQRFLSQ